MRSLLTIAATAVAVAASLVPNAGAQERCVGLDCPGVAPASSLAHGMLDSVASPRELEHKTVSGFYEFGLNNPAVATRAVAYVAAPGTLAAAPAEIKALPSAQAVSAAASKTDTVIVYGPGVVVTASAGDRGTAAQRSTTDRQKAKARAASLSQCANGWFCLWSGEGYSNLFGMWQDTGFWQNLATWGWDNLARSMSNRRSGATLLARGVNGSGGQRYCAQAGSVDSTFTNNSNIDQNAESLFNSTAANYHSGWDCFNPF